MPHVWWRYEKISRAAIRSSRYREILSSFKMILEPAAANCSPKYAPIYTQLLKNEHCAVKRKFGTICISLKSLLLCMIHGILYGTLYTVYDVKGIYILNRQS